MFYSQEDDGVVSLALPIRNSLTFNQYVVNPTFSFVRQQNKYFSITNKREWVQFENAPQTYLASYSGRFKENIGIGVGLFQQNYGVLTTFGGLLNFAYNARLDKDSNLTFGLNIGAYKSGINEGKVITNFPDPSLQNIPSNFMLTVNPGINYGTGFMDFGVSVNNLVLYNINSSQLIEENPQQSIQGHVMYTGYMDMSGFFDESKFSGLIKSEFKKDKTVVSAIAMVTVPKGIWAQVGYNNLYGASGGLGLNITKEIAIEYNFEKALGDLTDFGPSHEITIAYRFKNYDNYDYSGEDEVSALISGDRRKPVSKVANVNAEANRKLAAETKAQAKLDAESLAQIKAEEQLQAKLEAEKQAAIVAETKKALEEKNKIDADAKAKFDAETKVKADAIAKADAEIAKQRAAVVAKEVAEAKAKLALENKAKADAKAKAEAEAQSKLAAENKLKEDAKAKIDAKAKAEAEAQLKLAAEIKTKEEAKAKAEAARLVEESRLKVAAQAVAEAEKVKLAEQTKLKAELAANAKLEAEAKLKEESKAKADAEAARIIEETRLKAEALAVSVAEAEKVKLAQEALINSENEAKAKTEAEAKARETEKANADALELAKLEAENRAKDLAAVKLANETQAKLDAESKATVANVDQEKLSTNPTDDIAKSMSSIEQLTKDSEKDQLDLMSKYSDAIANKDKDLKDLKEENDLSDKGIFMEPKAFKSLTAENEALEALTLELDQAIETRNNRIKEMENLYEQRLKIFPLVNDEVNLYYQRAIKKLKAEQLAAIRTKSSLTSNLDQIKEAIEFERKRRIKRAAFDSEQDRYQQDRTALSIIKQNTKLSTVPLKSEDFEFGEEQSSNIQILKNVKNVENGFYLIVAVHNDVAKRDDFVKKVVASGRTDIDFFYDVNTSKYFIYYDKFDSIEEANEALKSKGNRPYNIKMSLIKIEN